VQVGDLAPRLLDEKDARGHVPRVQRELPEAIETSGGQVGQVEGGRADPTNGLGALNETLEVLEVVDLRVVDVVGEPGGEQRLLEPRAARDPDPAVVQEGTPAPERREELLLDRVVDDAYLALAVPLDPDRNRKVIPPSPR
jgi:hypothetical protein